MDQRPHPRPAVQSPRFLRASLPDSADGIEKYLSFGMIRGVGPVYAKKLVRAFGEKVFDVIEATPDRLRDACADQDRNAQHSVVCECSILLREHDRDDPVGDGRIGWIGRMHRQLSIEIIDLEHDHLTFGFERPKVVFLMRIVRMAKIIEDGDRLDDPLDGLGRAQQRLG